MNLMESCNLDYSMWFTTLEIAIDDVIKNSVEGQHDLIETVGTPLFQVCNGKLDFSCFNG